MSKDQIGTAEIGLMGMAAGAAPTSEEAVQRSISQGLAGVLADARRSNPNALSAPPRVTVAGAPTVVTARGGEPVGRGWEEPLPLTLPPGQRIIEGLVNAALPSPAMEKLRASVRSLTAEQRAELLKGFEAHAQGPS
jgi:hypothetical protein